MNAKKKRLLLMCKRTRIDEGIFAAGVITAKFRIDIDNLGVKWIELSR